MHYPPSIRVSSFQKCLNKPASQAGFFCACFFSCIFYFFRLYFFPIFFRLRRAFTFPIVPLLMKNSRTHTSPSTLTRQAQARILRKHLRAFVKAQAKATEALRAINAIAMCENDGNPLSSALSGTTSVVCFAGCPDCFELSVDHTLTEAQQALNFSQHWASND